MKWLKDMIASLTAPKSKANSSPISQDIMIEVANGILDNEMMDGLVKEFNAHQGMGIYCMGNHAFGIPYDKLKGLSVRTYFVAPAMAEEFKAKAMIAENAGQPLDREIVTISPEIDPKALEVIANHFDAVVLDLKPNEALFKSFTLCAVSRNVADQFRKEIQTQGQFSLELVND